jgi:hypothetical protein
MACSICSRPEILAMVTRYLDFKPAPTLDQLAKWCGGGISRSTLHRHRSKCVPAMRAEQVRARLRPTIGRSHNLLVVLPSGDEFFQIKPVRGLPVLTIEVRYESPRETHDVARDIFGRKNGEMERDIFGNLPEQPAPGE